MRCGDSTIALEHQLLPGMIHDVAGRLFRRIDGRLVSIVALYSTGDPRVVGMIDAYGNRILMTSEFFFAEPASDTVH